jgi:hypothetical protein
MICERTSFLSHFSYFLHTFDILFLLGLMDLNFCYKNYKQLPKLSETYERTAKSSFFDQIRARDGR